MELNKKKTYRRFIYSPLFLLLLLSILLVLLKAVWGVYKKEEMSSNYLAREQLEFTKLKSREKELGKSVEYLKTEKGIEAEIRSKFRVVKEGESVAVIIDNDASNTAPISTTTSRSIWTRIYDIIVKIN